MMIMIMRLLINSPPSPACALLYFIAIQASRKIIYAHVLTPVLSKVCP
jgi:hypothetical protein